ncbi:helix-turn-helix domain-containing protein [Maledivibacter halophilus]|uniref:Response regulator containing CheY-like receiver domain and AraC-type DNA-binding domain n=1 Tax=Maledivibacter halophilus TaxID=36842 RepID=A0A1T5MJ11_9FIRM|nr:helix-turn-helix domain-containing protein [Maledivibacter halophilus]SKC88053.1 Response regulator containing CheY-like receiver domain and AraC-type DNA-binding domain [Maledivibacter halophilus]
MNYKELDNYLREITPSEKWHLENPGEISKFYEKVDKVKINDSLVYLFDFGIRLKKENITINKDSRFTYLPKHVHADMEMNYIYSGSCTYIIDGKTVVLNKGDICLLDTNVIHSTKTTRKDDIVVNISMTKSFFNTSFLSRLSNQGIITSFLINSLIEDQSHSKYIVFRSSNKYSVDILMKNLLCEYFDRDICYDEVLDSYMIIIFSELVRIFNENNTNEFALNIKKPNNIINMLQYIENNYHTCTLTSMAQNFGYNPNYLGSLLKNRTGKTFSQLKLEHQIKQASILIACSEMPIYKIALDVGISNLGFFYKKFKKVFGLNPQEYRDNYIIKNKY